MKNVFFMWLRHKQQARERLLSPEGIKHRKKRPCDTEPVFGNLKYNKKFKRFNLRGMQKVQIEVGLLAIANNLMKVAKENLFLFLKPPQKPKTHQTNNILPDNFSF